MAMRAVLSLSSTISLDQRSDHQEVISDVHLQVCFSATLESYLAPSDGGQRKVQHQFSSSHLARGRERRQSERRQNKNAQRVVETAAASSHCITYSLNTNVTSLEEDENKEE